MARCGPSLNKAAAIALLLATSSLSGRADAGEARTSFQVTATVTQSAQIRTAHQTPFLSVTAEDVQRGFASVRAGSRIDISAPGGYLLEFRLTGEPVRSVRVTGAGKAIEFGPTGGTLYERAAAAALVLDYRFELAPGSRPGRYAWPVMLTVLPM